MFQIVNFLTFEIKIAIRIPKEKNNRHRLNFFFIYTLKLLNSYSVVPYRLFSTVRDTLYNRGSPFCSFILITDISGILYIWSPTCQEYLTFDHQHFRNIVLLITDMSGILDFWSPTCQEYCTFDHRHVRNIGLVGVQDRLTNKPLCHGLGFNPRPSDLEKSNLTS